MRCLFFVLPLALCLVSPRASADAKDPPAEYAAYVAAIRKADSITDPLQRCLAYPDLPGSTWAPGLAKAQCTMFLTPPAHTLDDIERAIAQPGGAATLDSAFRKLLDAHFIDSTKREQIFTAIHVFKDPDHDKAERIARAWVAASPESPFARTALGRVLESRGWGARGTQLVSKTPSVNLQKMSRYFVDAAKEYIAAIESSPKLIPACEGLMAIGRQSSDDVQAFATERCVKADPASYYLVEELLTAAEPRWGGSEVAMRTISAYAQAQAAERPVLGLFAFHHAAYEIQRMKNEQNLDAQAIAILEPAALQVPNAAYLRLVGGAYLRKDDLWKSLVYLSQALRFAPTEAQESRFRSLVLDALGETKWAQTDALRAVTLDPKSGHALLWLGSITRKINGPLAAAPYFQRAIEDPMTRESAFNDYCGVMLDAERLDEADKCIDALLAAYPENPEGWRQRLVLIGFDVPGSKEAMERFVKLHDPTRWSYHADALRTVRMVQAAKDGTVSPAERFEARVARATAMGRSLVGRPYVERLRSSSNDELVQATSACRSVVPPGTGTQFVAIMDVQENGSPANVEVRPANAWTTCFAKYAETNWKLPTPPTLAESSRYPLIYDGRMN